MTTLLFKATLSAAAIAAALTAAGGAAAQSNATSQKKAPSAAQNNAPSQKKAPSATQSNATNQRKPPTAASEKTPKGPKVANPIPSPNAQLMMIRDALIAFNQANLTNNYSVMHALGSYNFRVANAPERLGQLFAVYRINKVNLQPVLYLNPTLTRPAALESGRLKLTGTFPSKPMEVIFDLTFEPSDGQWKLFAISVALNPDRATVPHG